MLENFTQHYEFLVTQSKSFSFVVLVITFALIFLNFGSNIIPLNIIVLLGSIFMFHYYPGYYHVVNAKAPKLTPLLVIFDFILHYSPLIYIIVYKVYNRTEINYTLCFAILTLYILLFHSEIHNIYFNYNRYLS
jgi:hypothetical protein